jgi:hypothetical protein
MTQSDTSEPLNVTGQLNQLRAELAQRDRALSQLRTRHALELRLRDAGTVDIDAALALAERALADKPEPAETDAQSAVTELQRMRPWLFQTHAAGSPVGSGVQSAAVDDARSQRARRLSDAAEDASVSGSRMDLLRYLRLRRKRQRS